MLPPTHSHPLNEKEPLWGGSNPFIAARDFPQLLFDLSEKIDHSEEIMQMVAFDTHAFVKKLTKAGMPEPQAEVLASEQSRLIENELATKQDIEQLRLTTKRDMKELETALKRDIAELRTELKRDISEFKAEILKWMFGALLGQTAILTALIKLL